MTLDPRMDEALKRMARLAALLDALANEASRLRTPHEGALWVAADYALDTYTNLQGALDQQRRAR